MLGQDRICISAPVSLELRTAARRESALSGLPVAEILRRALLEYLAKGDLPRVKEDTYELPDWLAEKLAKNFERM